MRNFGSLQKKALLTGPFSFKFVQCFTRLHSFDCEMCTEKEKWDDGDDFFFTRSVVFVCVRVFFIRQNSSGSLKYDSEP